MKPFALAVCFVLLVASLLISPSQSLAERIYKDEIQVTATTSSETTPAVCSDSKGSYLVYTARRPLTTGGFGDGNIYYQRFNKDGLVDGPVQVTTASTDDQLNDCSGDIIVFSAYESTTSNVGEITLYQISSGMTLPLSNPMIINEPRIFGNAVVWRQGAAGSTKVMLFDLNWAAGSPPQLLGGPAPPTVDVAVGDRFVAWGAFFDAQYDIFAYDLQNGTSIQVTNTSDTYERRPATTGDWVFWEARDYGARSSRVQGVNLETGETRLIADDGVINRWPTAAGDYVAYESNLHDSYDTYVYEISSQKTGQITADVIDQYLNDIGNGYIAYVDRRDGDDDIFLSAFKFNDLPVIHLSQTNILMQPGETVQISAIVTDPDGDTIDLTEWFVEQAPQGSAPYLNTPNDQSTSFTPDIEGEYLLGFRASDGLEGEYAYAQVNVEENQFPIIENITASPLEGLAPLEVAFSANAYDPEGQGLTLEWDFGDLGSKSISSSPTHTFWGQGDYQVALTATDSWGQSTEEQITVSVYENRPPEISILVTPVSGPSPLTVQFHANGYDPDGDPIGYTWSFGDPASGDNTSNEASTTHTYDESGEYTYCFFAGNFNNEQGGCGKIVVDSPITFSVTKATVMWPNPNKKSLGLIKVDAAIDLALPGPDEVIEAYFDGTLLGSAVFGDFLLAPGTTTYRYEEPLLTIEIDIASATLSIVKNKVDMNAIELADGAEVMVVAGGRSVIENITMEAHNKNKWTYGDP